MNSNSSAADLFAFQGNHTKPTSKAAGLPDDIASWPALPADPLAASIKPSPRPGDNRPGEELDEKDLTNVDSVLVAADTGGRLHCFLDGSYPLGAITLDPSCEVKALMKENEGPFVLLVHAEFKAGDAYVFNNVVPFSVQLPLLGTKAVRRVAENSSAARELIWYIMRVVKEMRNSWFGGEGLDGAREMNLNYVRGLEERQNRFSCTSWCYRFCLLLRRLIRIYPADANPVFDLTCLLTTGKSTPALSDFNQTGDQTSDRVRHRSLNRLFSTLNLPQGFTKMGGHSWRGTSQTPRLLGEASCASLPTSSPHFRGGEGLVAIVSDYFVD